MQSLELKIPPLAVVLVIVVLMWMIARALPSFTITIPAYPILAVALVFVGFVCCLAGVLAFKRHGTTVNPVNPDAASKIVSNGIYAYSRNPMYLGFLFCIIAWAVYLSHLLAMFMTPLFVLYMNIFQIRPEERILRNKFGGEFTRYMARVRRWL